MQRKSSARQKAVTDTQRGAAAQAAGRVAREAKTVVDAPPSSHALSGEVTLGGHADRGLTLAGLYDIGVLERLRLEVRVRLLSDLAQSLAALHLNPRLMAAHPHLVIAPSTVVIGLDGVARVDVRAAKKQESERNPLEEDYVAPELMSGDGSADKRADVFSLGVIAWEAVAGKRLNAATSWAGTSRAADESTSTSDLPAALGGGRAEREPLRRKPTATRAAPQSSHSRLRAPPPLVLPEGGDWATALAELAMQAMCPDPADRPQDCRPLIHELELIAEYLASTQEIAEVVQGISSVDTLCIPLPKLPDADTACQADATGRLGFMDRQACVGMLAPSCAQRQMPTPRRVVEPVAPAAPAEVAPRAAPEPQPELSTAVMRLRAMGSSSTSAWFVAALLSLLVLGTLAGYAASLLAVR